MVKDKQKISDSSLYVKRFFALILICICLFPVVSAFDWDNKLTYLNNDLKVEFDNTFLGIKTSSIGTIELKSHSSVEEIKQVPVGKNVVMWYDFNFKELYANGIGEIYFYNMKNDGKEIEKEYSLVYLTIEDKEVYGEGNCKTLLKNGTGIDCQQVVVGTKKIEVWKPYISKNVPMGNITIGIELEVLSREKIDVVWEIVGKKVTRHAIYTGNGEVSNGLETITTGGDSDYTFNLYALTNGVLTLIRYGSSDSACVETNTTISQNGVLLAWKQQACWDYNDGRIQTFSLEDYSDVIQSGVDGGKFSVRVYKIGGAGTFGYKSGANQFNGSLFEYASQNMMGRHSGQPAVPIFTFNETADNFAPQVIVHNPVNATKYIIQNVLANATISDDSNLTRVDLYVNGILNQTNYSMGLYNNTVFNFDLTLSDGYYNLSFLATDNASLTTQSLPRFFTINTTPNIQFISPTPANATTQAITYIPVNLSITETYFKNVTFNFYKNGVLDESVTFTDSTRFYNKTGCTCANWEFNAIVWTTTGQKNQTETRSILVDLINPVVNITAPPTSFDYLYNNYTLDLNWTVTDANLDRCWYNYSTNRTFIDCNLNTTTFQYISGTNSISFSANDTAGNIGTDDVSWSALIIENSQTYNTEVYETSLSTITINVTYNPLLATTAILNYNGINYSSINLGSGTTGIFTSEDFNVPLIEGNPNKTFYWIFNVNGTILETSPLNQTVISINIAVCNATTNITVLNFTFYDELKFQTLNAVSNKTTIKTTFEYWTGNGGVKKTYSYQNLSSNKNNYLFCIDLNTAYNINLDMQYSAQAYDERTYYFRNKTINNLTQSYLLYVLPTTDVVKFEIEIRQGISSFTNAITEVWKYFVGLGTYGRVMVGLTDEKGVFSAPLELDQTYDVRVYKDDYSYGNFSKQTICSATPCEIVLNIEESVVEAYASFYEYFAENIDYNFTYNATTKIVTLNFKDNLNTAQYWRLLVYQSSYLEENTTIICDTKSYSTAGTLTCNYTGYSGNNIYAKTYISRSPEKVVEIINLIDSVPVVIGITAFLASIMFLLFFFFSAQRNPVNAIIMIPFAIVVLKLVGWLPLSWYWVIGLVTFCIWIIKRLNT